MKQTFGSFIKAKRTESMMKLKVFAQLIGISSVYLSYLENNKRPAPSEKVLKKIIEKLDLDTADTKKLMKLAAETHNRPAIPSDLVAYINSTDYIIDAIRLARDHHISQDTWLTIIDIITESTDA